MEKNSHPKKKKTNGKDHLIIITNFPPFMKIDTQ